MTPGEWLRVATEQLSEIRDPDAASDAMVLLTHVTGLPRHKIRLENESLSEETVRRLDALLTRRLHGEPVQYVTGEAWFMGLPFRVDGRCLIPRADTEILTEEAVRIAKKLEKPRVLDMCTGSGCIGLSVKHCVPGSRVTLADIDPGALSIARENGERLSLSAEYIQTDLFSALSGREFDVISCNPPYIPDGDIASLDGIVQKEPRLALAGGEDGLDFYRRLREEAPAHMAEGGCLIMEIGIHQAEDIRRLFGDVPILPDLSGIPRTAVWHKE